MMKNLRCGKIVVTVGLMVLGASLALAWTPKPVKEDRNLFMPGTQQGAVALEKAQNNCLNCHAGYDLNAEPGRNWQGSMMAQAARDPLWLACMTVADQDSIWALGNPNAGDLCIRCHSPIGWLGGRSDPPNASALAAGSGDFEGVSCDACHRALDPFNALHQPGLPAETNATAIAEDTITTNADNTVLQTLLLFESNAFYNASTRLPFYYGAGDITNYSEATSGQYFVDTINANYKRGPYYDADPKSHNPFYSRFHKSRGMCATCHDVSNPALANVVLGTGVPERQAAGSYFHVERTLSEFKLSAYGRGAGTNTNPKIAASGVASAATCQDCHMRFVTGKACDKNVQVRPDIALHDLTGGNAWISRILASADQGGPVYSAYNYNILSGAKYPNAHIDVAGLQGLGPQLTNGAERALAQLHMAATLEVVSNTVSETTLRIINNTGHKLISGFPEGRRMWLNVKFYNGADTLIDEVNPYTPLVVTNIGGNFQYVSGAVLTKTRDDLVYETAMMSSLTSEDHTFHFVLATDRYKDNRIPPKGFDIASAASRKAQPRWDGADTNYFTAAEYTGGYDEVTFTKPGGTARWVASMYYQTTSKDYVEFLHNEILATNTTTLSSPTPSGETNAYIVQTDSFFTTLKGWGNAIYDLWLANEGAAPVLMTSTNVLDPVAVPPVFAGLQTATAGIESVTLTWSAASSSCPSVTYNVFQATTGGGQNFMSPVFLTNALSALITPLYPGSNSWLTYYFVVRASDSCGGSETNTVELSVQPLVDPVKDQDGDGMPNSYEQDYGLDPFDAADASLDPDGDGFTSLLESVAGTSPISGGDLPKVESVTPDVDGIHIWFQTVSDRQYQVQWRDSYTEGDWGDLGSPVNGDDTLHEVTDTPSAGTTARFYRLVITRP
jgi:Cytochrome c554 and c-prime